MDTPEVIARYLSAADAGDTDTLVDCFAPDGTALDEGQTFTGRDEIRAWRDSLAQRYTYTVTITGTAPAGDGYDVSTHLKGDFPGGEADLTYHFVLRDNLIASLSIV